MLFDIDHAALSLYHQIYKYYTLFSSLPQIACLAFLSFQYPLLLFKGFQKTETTNASEVRGDHISKKIWAFWFSYIVFFSHAIEMNVDQIHKVWKIRT